MGIFDDDEVKIPRKHEIGQDLALLSVDELRNRIGMLQQEIARIEAELSAKGVTKAAAEALFRR